jgi:hypothetical protein
VVGQDLHWPRVIARACVVEGKIVRDCRARLRRQGTVIWEGKIASLMRGSDIAEVTADPPGYGFDIELDGV